MMPYPGRQGWQILRHNVRPTRCSFPHQGVTSVKVEYFQVHEPGNRITLIKKRDLGLVGRKRIEQHPHLYCEGKAICEIEICVVGCEGLARAIQPQACTAELELVCVDLSAADG